MQLVESIQHQASLDNFLNIYIYFPRRSFDIYILYLVFSSCLSSFLNKMTVPKKSSRVKSRVLTFEMRIISVLDPTMYRCCWETCLQVDEGLLCTVLEAGVRVGKARTGFTNRSTQRYGLLFGTRLDLDYLDLFSTQGPAGAKEVKVLPRRGSRVSCEDHWCSQLWILDQGSSFQTDFIQFVTRCKRENS